MSDNLRLYARIVRRETHSPRSAPAIFCAMLAALVVAWLGIEGALYAAKAPALLVSPSGMESALRSVTAFEPMVLVAVGVALLALAVLALAGAVLPGTRARHQLASKRAAVVVDDAVVARAIALRVSADNHLDPAEVLVTVGRSTATATVTPISGVRLSPESIVRSMDSALTASALSLRPRAVIRERGNIA